MKKFLCICFIFLISTIKSYASDIKLIQIDNLKLNPYSEDSINNFQSIIKEINKQKNVDFVIFTGNNIAKSDKKSLTTFLKKANKLNVPYYIALGHKDLNKNKGVSKAEYIKNVKIHTHKNIKSPNYFFIKKDVIFIVADGAKEFIQTPFGYYRENVIEYIDKTLTKYQSKNAIILQHFPIIPPNENEAYNTYKREDYLDMLSRHKNVKAVISGFGINSENDIDGIKHITTADYPQYRIIDIVDGSSDNPTIWSTLK